MGTMITFGTPSIGPAGGYLAQAAQAGAPGVVVIQEWWGLGEQIKGICDRLALAGYDALAPDLYSGVLVPYHDSEAASREMNSLNFIKACDQNVRGAAQYLARNGAKVGVTGFCMGGALTILAAVRAPEIAAAVCFYGLPPTEAANPKEIKAPLQAHFANHDDWCTPKAVDEFEKSLKEAGKGATVFRYDADHAFVNEQRPEAHNRKEAELAWGRMLEFWKRHL